MIQGTGFHQAGYMLLEITQPGQIQPEYVAVRGETVEERNAKAWHIIFDRNRRRVSEIICSWLKQRQYALEQFDGPRAGKAQSILVLMHYYSHFNYYKLCKLIMENRSAIEYLAPGEKSRFYPHYQRVIVPLLNECQLMRNEEKLKSGR